MKRLRMRAVALLMLCSTFAVLTGHAATGRVVVGILPVYDASAEAISDRLATNLSFFTYQQLLKSTDITPVLLSPGGLYDPESEELIETYASRLKIDAVLITRLLPTIKVNDRTVRLNVEMELVDLASGKHSAKMADTTVQIRRDEVVATMETTYVNTTYVDFFGNTKEFYKQPLGKATIKEAIWGMDYAENAVKMLAVQGTGEELPPASGSCAIGVRVLYMTRHAASKSYSLLVNNEDESSTIKDGVANFTAPAGPISLRYAVNDAPYRFHEQKMYQSSSVVDCGQSKRMLVIELGTSGEATPHWE